MHNLSSIRAEFLDFFVKNNHKLYPSSPLVPYNDSTLLFTNSGMVQFKNVFRGEEVLKDGANIISKATTSQKVIRAGGKHNDLENVGFTARHHTFFEMLGNFSFGDYFKEQAIKYAWEFLTKSLQLPKEKLFVTVFPEDEVSYKLWQKIAGLKEDRIIKLQGNFWSMGDLGPCGYNSEIFYDHGPSVFGGLPGTKDEDGDRFVEIWNLVFMEFDQVSKEKRIPLPKKSVDTGMGLERITAVLQGVHNNYDIDLFSNLISTTKDIFKNNDANFASSYKVIADHLRSISFLIADGVLPASDGRGYVLRRIIRRAIRHANMLGGKEAVLYRLVPTLVETMGGHYAELISGEKLITETLKNEEEKFLLTLQNGLKILHKETASIKKGGVLNGEVAFKLYDTYGFPLDLTADILKSQKIDIDYKGFEQALENQKQNSKSEQFSGSTTKPYLQEIVDKVSPSEFLGYKTLQSSAVLLQIVSGEKLVSKASEGDKIELIFNQTPFYAESGGQAGDKGFIRNSHAEIEIYDTKKLADKYHLHFAIVKKGSVKVGEEFELVVNEQRRDGIKKNHTATHLLHSALHKTIGENAIQKGSLVEENYLRFDFAHNKSLSQDELDKIEELVNNAILKNIPLSVDFLQKEQAIKRGAKALFGEKYGDEVRVIGVEGTSIELCGGTHIASTGEIGVFKILKEGSVASGIRRIEAVTGFGALKIFQEKFKLINDLNQIINSNDEQLKDRIQKLIDANKDGQKLLKANQKQQLAKDFKQRILKTDDKYLLEIEGADNELLRELTISFSSEHKNATIFVVNESDGKKSFFLAAQTVNLKEKMVILSKNFAIKGGGNNNLIQGTLGANVDIKELLKNI